MPRHPKPPTVWQARWLRSRRIVYPLLVAAMVLSGIFISPGLSAAFFLLTVGLATFATGTPTDNRGSRAVETREG
ncbi:MAG: hypothetical protein Q7T55_14540 [Solirubrobacteraceae bacterium]|nr:hypothetical protein [Solirubrobacteraceae bacterium]